MEGGIITNKELENRELENKELKNEEMENEELDKLLQTVLQKYPELKKYSFAIKHSRLSDAFAMLTMEDKKVVIEIDDDLRNEDESLTIAAIASEVSHVLREDKLSLIPLGLGNYMEGWIYERSKIYRNYDKRQTDIETVRRGFGKQLLELLKYDDVDAIDECEKSEGLSVAELETILRMYGE